MKAFLGILLLGLASDAAPTISPASHDFGTVVVKGNLEQKFTITNAPANLQAGLVGPDVKDFDVNMGADPSCVAAGALASVSATRGAARTCAPATNHASTCLNSPRPNPCHARWRFSSTRDPAA